MAEESYSSLRLQAVRADGAASFYLPGKNIVIQLRPGQTYKDDYPAVTLVSSDHRRGETLITEQL